MVSSRAHARARTAMKRWPLLVGGAFALLALVETGTALTASRRVASDADWEAAAAEVRAGFHQGDLIVFAPAWADQVGRQHLGDLMPLEMVARPDDTHFARAWEVSIRGADYHRWDATPLASTSHGRVRVRLYALGAPAPLAYDFTAQLGEARVTQATPDGAETPCFRDGGAHRCAGTRVEARTLEVDYRPRRGILAPVDGRLTTRLEFSNVPGGTLRGYTAIHDYYSRKSADGRVDFALFVDGALAGTVRQSNADGWRAFSAPVPPGRHVVRFEVKSDAPAWRTFGFYAELVPEGAK
jgi:hypothetical protein